MPIRGPLAEALYQAQVARLAKLPDDAFATVWQAWRDALDQRPGGAEAFFANNAEAARLEALAVDMVARMLGSPGGNDSAH